MVRKDANANVSDRQGPLTLQIWAGNRMFVRANAAWYRPSKDSNWIEIRYFNGESESNVNGQWQFGEANKLNGGQVLVKTLLFRANHQKADPYDNGAAIISQGDMLSQISITGKLETNSLETWAVFELE